MPNVISVCNTQRRDHGEAHTKKGVTKMGVEFALTCIPLAKITGERTVELLEIASRITEDDFDNPDDMYDDFEDYRESVRKAVNELPDIESSHWRDVNHLQIMPGLPYDVLFAGGRTRGESPSDAYSCFEAINCCQPILEKLIEWAKVDKLREDPHDCGGAIGSQ